MLSNTSDTCMAAETDDMAMTAARICDGLMVSVWCVFWNRKADRRSRKKSQAPGWYCCC